MDKLELKDYLLKELNNLPVHNLTSNRKELSIRCPYCGDSRKNPKSSHLYVHIEPNDDEPFTFYCQRCKTGGIVNTEFFKMIKSNNSDLVINIEKFNKSKKSNKKFFNKELRRTKIEVPIPENNKLNLYKLKYINKRLGTNLSFSDLPDYKIILNLYDFLDLNKIKKLSCKEQFADTLDANFLGFLSYDNNYIVFRNLSKTELPELRYHNYNIFGNYDNTKKFYIMPNSIDLLEDTITVILTEGCFDLLSVYFNIEKDKKNKIYAAVNGIGYNAVLNEIIRMGFLNINLKIYGDNDQDIRQYKSLKNEFFPFVKRIELYTNILSKDFGDINNGIKIKKTLL